MVKGEKRTYCEDYSGDDSIPAFLAFAIEQYKHHKGITGEKAMTILSDSGVLEHLAEFYDVLHLHGSKWLMQEIDEMLAKKYNRVL